MRKTAAGFAILSLLLGFTNATNNCHRVLGANNKNVHFTCTTTSRTSLTVTWFKDGVLLNTQNTEKYLLNRGQNELTVHGIVASDEGNYTCSYLSGSNLRNSTAGCLLVYGKASFEGCRANTYQCTEQIAVSNSGTLTFDLSIAFSEPGKAGLLQSIKRTIIRKSDEVVLNYDYGTTTNTGNREWTINGSNEFAVLYNVIDTDRGLYTVETEAIDPGTGYITIITKQVFATGKVCNPPPEITNGGFTSTGVIVSSTAKYSCDNGYTLTGNDMLMCIQTANDTLWSGEIPSCAKNTESVNRVMFQLQIGPNQDCTCWDDDKSLQFLEEVKNQTLYGISNTCNCSSIPTRLTNMHIYCSEYPQYVSVRGFINGDENHTAEELLRYMELWRAKESTALLTQRRVLDINKDCKLQISEWNERECSPPPRLDSCSCNSTVEFT